MDIKNYEVMSGRMISEEKDENGNNIVYNVVDSLKGGEMKAVGTANIENYAMKSGRIIGEDNKIYNLVDLLKSGGGEEVTREEFEELKEEVEEIDEDLSTTNNKVEGISENVAEMTVSINKDKKYYTAITKNNCCKNLLNCNNLTEREYRGVNVYPVFREDGLLDYVVLNGTATSVTFPKLADIQLKANVTYEASLGVKNLNVKWDKSSVNNVRITPTEDILEDLRIRVNQGDSFDNVKVYPMVRYNDVEDSSYEPYYPTNKELWQMIKELLPQANTQVIKDEEV